MSSSAITSTLYVTGFTRNYQAQDLSKTFEKYGPVEKITCPPTKTPESAPFAFVTFNTLSAAQDALELNEKPWDVDESIVLRVEPAKSEVRPRRSGFRGGRGGYGRDRGYESRDRGFGGPGYGPPPRRSDSYRERGYGGPSRDYGPPPPRGYDRDRGYERERGYGRERRDDFRERRDFDRGREEGFSRPRSRSVSRSRSPIRDQR